MSETKIPSQGRFVLGGDHAGFVYKAKIMELLGEMGVEFEDYGANVLDAADDYVDFAIQVSRAVSEGKADYGILVCGSGVGMSIAANKFPGVRAALCSDSYTARVSREHNDANVLCLSERVIGSEVMAEIVKIWVSTPFSNEERHIRRLEKIRGIETAR
jgi:ribose 5-phosphate isomerase B